MDEKTEAEQKFALDKYYHLYLLCGGKFSVLICLNDYFQLFCDIIIHSSHCADYLSLNKALFCVVLLYFSCILMEVRQ